MRSDKKESLDFEIGFLESIHRRDTNDPRIIEVLASFYTEAGRLDEGLALDQKHVELEPLNPTAHYNLGCSLTLKNRFEEALEALKAALEYGFDDIDWMMKDPDLKALRRDKRFHQLLQNFQVRS
jgi:tetratricopeptide (TPR) repeat protein